MFGLFKARENYEIQECINCTKLRKFDYNSNTIKDM